MRITTLTGRRLPLHNPSLLPPQRADREAGPFVYEAGPTLDTLIIGVVLKLSITADPALIKRARLHNDTTVVFRRADGWYGRVGWQGRFSPCTDWRAMACVVERLLELGFTVQLFPGPHRSYAHAVLKVPPVWFDVERQRDPEVHWDDLDVEGFHMPAAGLPSVPVALCRAALAAMEDVTADPCPGARPIG